MLTLIESFIGLRDESIINSSSMASKFHVRSNSFPSGSHPSSSKVEEELNRIRTWESTTTSTSESICNGLYLIEDLYNSLDDLLNLRSTQKVISHHQGEKCVEEILDGSVRVLDICGITRDAMMQIKENVQILHSAIRRRKGDSSIEKGVAEYNLSSKKIKKNIKNLLKSLKQLQTKFGASSSLLNQDQDLVALVKILREIIAKNVSIFQSLLSFLVGPASTSKATKWMAKLMHKESIEREKNNELQCVDEFLSTLLSEGASVENMKATQESLEALETAIESLENRLESIFKRLIKTRTSLLNIISQ